jgi:hypothetical protein
MDFLSCHLRFDFGFIFVFWIYFCFFVSPPLSPWAAARRDISPLPFAALTGGDF